MKIGLDGVVAAETVLSHSGPQLSRLWIRGVPLEETVRDLGYEGTVRLLWDGFVGAGLTRERISAEFGAGRQRAFDHLKSWLPSVTGKNAG
jgi:citrate synthase